MSKYEAFTVQKNVVDVKIGINVVQLYEIYKYTSGNIVFRHCHQANCLYIIYMTPKGYMVHAKLGERKDVKISINVVRPYEIYIRQHCLQTRSFKLLTFTYDGPKLLPECFPWAVRLFS